MSSESFNSARSLNESTSLIVAIPPISLRLSHRLREHPLALSIATCSLEERDDACVPFSKPPLLYPEPVPLYFVGFRMDLDISGGALMRR